MTVPRLFPAKLTIDEADEVPVSPSTKRFAP
jgi:hypothetical protein